MWAPPVVVGAAAVLVAESRMISDATWAALIGGTPAIITAIVGGMILWRSTLIKVAETKVAIEAAKVETKQAVEAAKEETKTAIIEQKDATEVLKQQINHNLERQFEAFKNEVLAKERLYVAEKTETVDKLVASTAKASKLEGKEEERTKAAKEEKPPQAPKPAETTVNMEVSEMNVEELNAPKKK